MRKDPLRIQNFPCVTVQFLWVANAIKSIHIERGICEKKKNRMEKSLQQDTY